MKNLIRKILKEEFKKDKTITCDSCGWSWKLSEGGDDPYVCHKCWADNTGNYTIKEETENHIVSSGDVFRVNRNNLLVMVTKIVCNPENARYVTKHTVFGRNEIYHDGCVVHYKRSVDNGETWQSDEDFTTELNWIPIILEKGYWSTLHKGVDDIEDFFPD